MKNKKNISIILFVIMCITFIVGCVMLYKTHDKITNYKNSDFSVLNENAYVGGDAYNYIINGTYATTFSIIGMGCFIISIISFIGGCCFMNSMSICDGNGKTDRLPNLD